MIYNKQFQSAIKTLLLKYKCGHNCNHFDLVVKDLVNVICDTANNVLYNPSVKLSPKLKKKLLVHKQTLQTLANKRGSENTRQRLLLQKGGVILPLILPILASAIGGLK